MEKIFYNGTIGGGSSEHDALYIKNGQLVQTGYLNNLKLAHPQAIMLDLQRGFMLPATVVSHNTEETVSAPADLLVLNQNPFVCKENQIPEISILQVYKNGDRIY